MKDNNPIPFASGENGVIKTERQLLIEAEKKIGQMENERRLGIEHIERMKWQIAQLRMGVAALATHAKLTPSQVKEIYDAYVAEQDKEASDEASKLNQEMKKKFMEDLAAGKKVEFGTVERAPEGEPDTEAKPEDN